MNDRDRLIAASTEHWGGTYWFHLKMIDELVDGEPHRSSDLAYLTGGMRADVDRWCRTLVTAGVLEAVPDPFGLAGMYVKVAPEAATQAA